VACIHVLKPGIWLSLPQLGLCRRGQREGVVWVWPGDGCRRCLGEVMAQEFLEFGERIGSVSGEVLVGALNVPVALIVMPSLLKPGALAMMSSMEYPSWVCR
jgi:hypothetical protein